jgi:hypothetical protein
MFKAFLGFLLAGCGLLFIIFVVVELASTGPKSSSTQPDNNSLVSDASETSSAVPAITISAPKLYFDYHSNEVQADNVYKDRRLAVHGIVVEIRKDFLNNIIVELGSSNQFETVDAYMVPAESANAAALRKREDVTVACTGGGMVVGSPELKDCRFQIAASAEPTQPAVANQPTYPQAAPAQDPPITEQDPPQPVTSTQDNSYEHAAPVVRQPPSQAQPQD